jgi:hypothetical protein
MQLTFDKRPKVDGVRIIVENSDEGVARSEVERAAALSARWPTVLCKQCKVAPGVRFCVVKIDLRTLTQLPCSNSGQLCSLSEATGWGDLIFWHRWCPVCGAVGCHQLLGICYMRAVPPQDLCKFCRGLLSRIAYYCVSTTSHSSQSR